MTLFKTLMRAIYAVDGADGEFLADLTRPIPYTSSDSEVREGTLAEFPVFQHANLVGRISWHEEAIVGAVEFALMVRNSGDDHETESVASILADLDGPSQAVQDVTDLRAGLSDLRAELAAL
jgi:hypothetical protein